MKPHSSRGGDMLHRVVQRAERDAGFRARLIADPAAAIHETFGVVMPPHYRIRFVECPPDVDELVVIHPRRITELGDEDLDQVAGGGDTDGCAW